MKIPLNLVEDLHHSLVKDHIIIAAQVQEHPSHHEGTLTQKVKDIENEDPITIIEIHPDHLLLDIMENVVPHIDLEDPTAFSTRKLEVNLPCLLPEEGAKQVVLQIDHQRIDRYHHPRN